MIRELWDTFVMLIPIFFLLLLIFGAGFVIGRISIGRISKREQ
jgi:predicted MFS family arabinose efflux permease